MRLQVSEVSHGETGQEKSEEDRGPGASGVQTAEPGKPGVGDGLAEGWLGEARS